MTAERETGKEDGADSLPVSVPSVEDVWLPCEALCGFTGAFTEGEGKEVPFDKEACLFGPLMGTEAVVGIFPPGVLSVL